MSVITAIFRFVDSLLPTLPAEIVGTLHLIGLAGIAFAADIETISFKGNRIRVLGEFVTTKDAVVGLVVTLVVLATYNWWAEHVYGIFILTGWQAFGAIAVEVPWILTSRSQRTMDPLLWGIASGGVFLILMPWV